MGIVKMSKLVLAVRKAAKDGKITAREVERLARIADVKTGKLPGLPEQMYLDAKFYDHQDKFTPRARKLMQDLIGHNPGGWQGQAGPAAPVKVDSATVPLGRMEGKVTFWEDKKGYGFVTPSGGGDALFVHHSFIEVEGRQALRVGQKVTFEPGRDTKGEIALSVRPAK